MLCVFPSFARRAFNLLRLKCTRFISLYVSLLCFVLCSFLNLFFCSSRLFLVDFRILSLVLSYEKKIFSNNKTNLYASENCIRINEHRQCTLYSVHHRYEHFTHEEYILHSVDLIELMRLMCVCAYTLYCR